MTASQQRGRWVLLGMVLFFAAPLVIVLTMHFFNVHPTGASHGVLVTEAKPLKLPTSAGVDQSKLWQDKWNLLYVAERCEAVCQQSIAEMRQIHASLEKDIPRVQRVLITAQPTDASIKQQFPDLVIISDATTNTEVWQQVTALTQSQEASIYLVDPFGNLAMRFPPSLPAKDIRKDLVRLLKYSWAG